MSPRIPPTGRPEIEHKTSTLPRLAGILTAAAVLLLLALATAGPAMAQQPCWRDVLDDWTDNTRIDKTYEIACYNKALENLPEDIVNYTDAYDHIADARQAALRGEDLDRSVQGSGGAGDDDPDGGGGGFIGELLGIGSSDSGAIPLPLLILGGLATLLIAAGGAGLVARRVQARRTGPADL